MEVKYQFYYQKTIQLNLINLNHYKIVQSVNGNSSLYNEMVNIVNKIGYCFNTIFISTKSYTAQNKEISDIYWSTFIHRQPTYHCYYYFFKSKKIIKIVQFRRKQLALFKSKLKCILLSLTSSWFSNCTILKLPSYHIMSQEFMINRLQKNIW